MKSIAALILASVSGAALAQMSDGEVRKVDRNAGKITIKHGEIKSLGMPPMTMVFEVRDSRLLEGVKAGDQVLFDVEQQGGTYVLKQIEARK